MPQTQFLLFDSSSEINSLESQLVVCSALEIIVFNAPSHVYFGLDDVSELLVTYRSQSMLLLNESL